MAHLRHFKIHDVCCKSGVKNVYVLIHTDKFVDSDTQCVLTFVTNFAA